MVRTTLIVWVWVALLAIRTDAQTPQRLTMGQAVAQAQARSPSVAAARARVEAARSGLAAARAAAGLQATLSAYGAAASDEAMMESPPAAEPATRGTVGADGGGTLQAVAMVPVYTGGIVQASIRRARAMLVEAEADLARVRADVSAATKEAYLKVLLADATLRVAKAQYEAASAMAENARALWQEGKGIEAQYLRARSEAMAASRDIALAEAERAKSLVELAAVMGLSPGTRLELTDELSLTKPAWTLEAALAAGRKDAPALRMARASSESAAAQAAIARGEQSVQVYAMAMGDVRGSRGMRGTGMSAVGLAASWPLYDGGRRRSMRKMADAEEQASRERTVATSLSVEEDIRKACFDMEAAQSAVEAAQAAVDAARASYTVYSERVQNQKSILVEELDALAAVRKAELALAQSMFDHEMALVRLERVLGASPDGASGGATSATRQGEKR